jgi:hypothetical protein
MPSYLSLLRVGFIMHSFIIVSWVWRFHRHQADGRWSVLTRGGGVVGVWCSYVSTLSDSTTQQAMCCLTIQLRPNS